MVIVVITHSTCLKTGSLYILTTFLQFYFLISASGNQRPDLFLQWVWGFCFVLHILTVSKIKWCYLSLTYFTSHNALKFIHVVVPGRISSFYDWIIFCCLSVSIYLYIAPSLYVYFQWTLRIFPYLKLL